VARERLLTDYSGHLFLILSVGWLFIQMGRQLIPPLLPDIIDDLAITSTEAGVALTNMWGIYAIGQYPGGRFSDRLSRKTLLVLGLSCLILGFAILSGTVAYPMLLVGAGVTGLGAGLYPAPARALISDLFVRRRGQAFGLHTASGDLGNASAAGLAIVAVAVATWQAAFLPIIVLLCGTLIAIHIWCRESYVFERASLDIRSTVLRLFGSERVGWLLVAYALYAFTWQSSAGFLPTFLQIEKGLSVGLASAGFALLFVVGTLVKPISGLLGDKFGRTLVAIGGLTVGLIGLVCVLVAQHTLLILVGVGIFAAGLMSFPPAMQAYLMDLFPDGNMGGDLGAVRTFYLGVGSLGPTYVGFVANYESYTTAFVGLCACMLAGASIIAAFERKS
jgi:MFS family permease